MSSSNRDLIAQAKRCSHVLILIPEYGALPTDPVHYLSIGDLAKALEEAEARIAAVLAWADKQDTLKSPPENPVGLAFLQGAAFEVRTILTKERAEHETPS